MNEVRGDIPHFYNVVTKSITVKDTNRRLFEGILTVEMVDKQNEITIVDELAKALPIWLARGGFISHEHSNLIVGKGLYFNKIMVEDDDGNKYPAISIVGEIFSDYDLDNLVWDGIKDGTYKGLSFGGATRSKRSPVKNKDGGTSYALSDLEHYEVAVTHEPAVPLALILDHNQLAKSNMVSKGINMGNGKSLIRCTSVGCHIDKSKDSTTSNKIKWNDTRYTDLLPDWEGDKQLSSKPSNGQTDSTEHKEEEYRHVMDECKPPFKSASDYRISGTTKSNNTRMAIHKFTDSGEDTDDGVHDEQPNLDRGGRRDVGDRCPDVSHARSGMESTTVANPGSPQASFSMGKSLQNMIGEMIDYWHKSDEEYAKYYIDAYQSVYKNLFGKLKRLAGVEHVNIDRPVSGIDDDEDEASYRAIPMGKGDDDNTKKIIEREHQLIDEGIPEERVHEMLIEEFGKSVGTVGNTISVSEVRAEEDETAEGLKNLEEKIHKMFGGGIKGSYDTAEQGSGETRQVSSNRRNIEEDEEYSHGRDTVHVSNGHDDGYSLGKASLIKLKSHILNLKLLG